MKKLLSVLLAALMVFGVVPMALPQTVTAATTDRVAYLDATNGNDESASLGVKDKAFQTFEAAYGALAPEGGKLILTSPYTFTASIENGLATHYGVITITADDKSQDYIKFNFSDGFRILFAGPVVIENIRLYAVQNAYIYANYHKLIIGEGVVCEKTLGTALSETGSVAGNIAVLGGGINSVHRDTDVTIQSGVWRAVAGGGRATGAIMNGNFQVRVEGGYVPYLFGGNWLPGGAKPIKGGQAYITVVGGKVNQLYAGGQYANQLSYLDSVIVCTGGTIGSIRSAFCAGNVTVVYGGEIERGSDAGGSYFTLEKNTTSAEKSYGSTYLDGITLLTRDNTDMNVIPLMTGENPVVYVSGDAPLAGDGSSEHPVRYLYQAIAMLSETGGTIKLLDDYKFTSDETTSLSQFVEFKHNEPITIDGQGHKITGLASTTCEHTAHEQTITHTGAFATYVLNGDTTFKDVTFVLPRDTGIAANFNKLVLDDVNVTGDYEYLRVYGGVYLHLLHLANTVNCRAAYATWSDKDTDVTIKGENCSSRFIIYGFSRFNGAGNDSNPNAALTEDGSLLHYPGTANITVQSGVIDDIFPAMIYEENSKLESARLDHTAQSAIVNIGGTAKVYDLYIGGDEKGCSIAGDVVYNVTDDASVNNFGSIDNCDGTRYYNINNDYATYLKAKAKFASDTDDIVLSTEIAAPEINSVSFGTKAFGDATYGVRAKFKTASEYWEGENADDYKIVELGVLVAAATNEAPIKYVKGDYYYGVSEFGESPANYDAETKIGKSVTYVKEANAEAASYDAYAWAGADAADTAVYFTAPVIGIGAEALDTALVFVPYMVMVDEAGVQQVFYGEATNAVSYNGLIGE